MKRPIHPMKIFVLGSVILAAVLFLSPVPINLFDGVIEMEEPQRAYQIEAPLSLSYLIGIGYDPEDMQYVKDFYLTPRGYILAALIIFGFPGLFAYRHYLRLKAKERESTKV